MLYTANPLHIVYRYGTLAHAHFVVLTTTLYRNNMYALRATRSIHTVVFRSFDGRSPAGVIFPLLSWLLCIWYRGFLRPSFLSQPWLGHIWNVTNMANGYIFHETVVKLKTKIKGQHISAILAGHCRRPLAGTVTCTFYRDVKHTRHALSPPTLIRLYGTHIWHIHFWPCAVDSSVIAVKHMAPVAPTTQYTRIIHSC